MYYLKCTYACTYICTYVCNKYFELAQLKIKLNIITVLELREKELLSINI